MLALARMLSASEATGGEAKGRVERIIETHRGSAPLNSWHAKCAPAEDREDS
jgi:hypothetical protein